MSKLKSSFPSLAHLFRKTPLLWRSLVLGAGVVISSSSLYATDELTATEAGSSGTCPSDRPYLWFPAAESSEKFCSTKPIEEVCANWSDNTYLIEEALNYNMPLLCENIRIPGESQGQSTEETDQLATDAIKNFLAQ